MPRRAKDILRLVQVSSEVEITDYKYGGRERETETVKSMYFSALIVNVRLYLVLIVNVRFVYCFKLSLLGVFSVLTVKVLGLFSVSIMNVKFVLC